MFEGLYCLALAVVFLGQISMYDHVMTPLNQVQCYGEGVAVLTEILCSVVYAKHNITQSHPPVIDLSL